MDREKSGMKFLRNNGKLGLDIHISCSASNLPLAGGGRERALLIRLTCLPLPYVLTVPSGSHFSQLPR